MIRDINKEDVNCVNTLAKNYDNNFENHYNLNDYINNDIYILKCYEEDNIIKGFIIANNLIDDIEILLIYVDTNYRNNGIATKLIDSLGNNKDIILEVATNNEAALNLYKKENFNIINIRKKYYGDIDAYVMKKDVK